MITSDLTRNFGALVRAVREERQWTQTDLAGMLGAHLHRDINTLVVTRIERGQRPTPLDEVAALAHLLELDPADCLAGESRPRNRTTGPPKRFLITHPKGKGEDVLVEDQHLRLEFTDGWAVLSDTEGPCLAIPAACGATIQRIDPDETGQAEDETTHEGPAPEE